MAAYAARGGMYSLVLIPEGKISWGKLSQSLDYGAVTCQVEDRFRWLYARAQRNCEAQGDLCAELDQSIPA